MIKEEQLDNMLYEKMQKEYDSFLEKIKSEQSLKPIKLLNRLMKSYISKTFCIALKITI